MALKQLGTPIQAPGPKPIPEEKSGNSSFGNNLSEKARKDIEKIEANVRNAERRIGAFILR
jgi:hypothetical protein